MTRPTWHLLRDLETRVERVDVRLHETETASGFRRLTTTVHLSGGGEEGVGEDVTYSAADQRDHARRAAELDPAGTRTLEELSAWLAEADPWPPAGPGLEMHRPYRRWAWESAALDLALRQAGTSLADRIGRTPRPVRFVASRGLGGPPSLAPLEHLLERDPSLRFKLDASPAWDDGIVRALRELDRVDVVDLKGCYRGTPVDQPADPELYARVLEGLPGCLVEDPAVDATTRPLLAESWHRVAWDAPIHSAADVEALEHPPGAINVKPSRSGTVRDLLGLYDGLAERGVTVYGGGQFELSRGRGQIQLLAALFHPDAPNDVAPGVYNLPAGETPAPLPGTPLPPDPAPRGFGWRS